MKQYNVVRSYSVDLDEEIALKVEEYDGAHDTSYLTELIDACTRTHDVGTFQGTMYLLLDGDSDDSRSWLDENPGDQGEPLFECFYNVEETDSDYEDA